MENTYFNFSDFLKDFKAMPKREVNQKSRFNGDFCMVSPANKNSGILTMAFVDMQPLDGVYSMSEGFANGTIFPNLDKPFFGGRMK